MKIGKVYRCDENCTWVQAVSENRVNTVCPIEGVNIGVMVDMTYYSGKISKVNKKTAEWFLECIIKGEYKQPEDFRSKKDIAIEELIHRLKFVLKDIELWVPGYAKEHFPELVNEKGNVID
jgi:hypothetical protein